MLFPDLSALRLRKFRSGLLAGCACFVASVPAFAQEATETITVTAERLSEARHPDPDGRLDLYHHCQDIDNQPGGDNSVLN